VLTSLLLAAAAVAADTTRYVVVNHGRPAGEMVVARGGDSVTVRYQFVDRNRGTRVEQRYRFLPGGALVAAEARPLAPDGRPGEPNDRFEIVADSVRRSGPGGRVVVTRADTGTWVRFGATPYDQALLARWLLARPRRAGRIGTSTPVRVEIAREATVPARGGRQRVRLAMIHSGSSPTPVGVWLDAQGALFASQVGWFITVRPGAEGALPTLRALETAYRDAKADSLARSLARPVGAVLAITNGDLFDSERGVMRPRTTVLVRGDRIVAVGPADSVAVPAGATVIDATGKSVLPGLVDMHGHLQLTSETSASLLQLATGLTTVRDLAADTDVATSQRDRSAAGRIVAPRAVLAGIIEGPGRWAGPTDVLVRTEEEARAWVARYDSLGYRQVKLYNLVHPDLVPTIAAEARRRGMRLSGHVPRGLSVPAAVRLGFDEINHAAFLFSTFYQDSLYYPAMRAYSAVATAVAPNVDVDGAAMTSLIAFLKERGTVIDGTFNLWISSAGAPNPAGGQSADTERADRNYLRLIKRLYDAGVTLVPGTDNSTGLTFPAELELYERAGIPAAEVLRLATLVPARVMREERDYGSVVPGKVADLVVVDGRPAERVSDVRKVRHVIRAGRPYEPDALRAAAGFGGQ
jgi:imidazolonepropionase-like amidohydrolase